MTLLLFLSLAILLGCAIAYLENRFPEWFDPIDRLLGGGE